MSSPNENPGSRRGDQEPGATVTGGRHPRTEFGVGVRRNSLGEGGKSRWTFRATQRRAPSPGIILRTQVRPFGGYAWQVPANPIALAGPGSSVVHLHAAVAPDIGATARA